MNSGEHLLAVDRQGVCQAIYDDGLAPILAALGRAVILRASHVEPVTEDGWTIGWQADLSPVGGPVLGPFAVRQEALDAERAWLTQAWLAQPASFHEETHGV